ISEELSYLSGEASTREKAQRFITSQGRGGNYLLGLFIARDRELVVRLLEGSLRDLNTPVTHLLLRTLPRLRLLLEGRGPPTIDAGVVFEGDQYHQRSLEILEEYLRELTLSLPKRTGKSRTATAMTILMNLPKDPDRAAQMLGGARKILLQDFDSLSAFDQEYLLRVYWDKLRDPSLLPVIERILTKERQPQGSITRASALKRLMELDPERSRSFVVTELRDPASVVDLEVLEALKDETLPEADAALLEQIRLLAPLKQNRDSVLLRHKALLAARFASPAIYDGLM